MITKCYCCGRTIKDDENRNIITLDVNGIPSFCEMICDDCEMICDDCRGDLHE